MVFTAYTRPCAPTMTKLVEGEGAIASRRGIAMLRSLAKATILWQGKLAGETGKNLVLLTGLLLMSSRAAHNDIVLQQNCPCQWKTTSLECFPRGGGRKRNGTAHFVQLPFDYCSMPVHCLLFLNGHPLYGRNGGTFN